MPNRTYEELKAAVLRAVEQGQLDPRPSRDQRIDWAYGTTKIENEATTREMAARAVDAKYAR